MRRFILGLCTGLYCLLSATAAGAQCVSLTTLGSASAQSFDTLSNTAGSTTNNLTITDWFLNEAGGGARDNEQYGVDTGGSNTGDTYSYGSAGSTDRALGGLRSGTLIPIFGACFTNNTGSTLNSISLAYTGEHWRLGTTGRADTLNVEFSTTATSLTTGTWTDMPSLAFSSPTTTTAGVKDGNVAANRTALSHNQPLALPNGATMWIRFVDFDATGADDGLAVDDFSITPQGGGPTLPTISINDVSLNEGDSGTTNFQFTVSLSAGAPLGGVSFDISTADNTATTADNDYVLKSLAGQTIPSGASTYAFAVLVNGDTAAEPNQTFFVNLSNITNATGGDIQGQGTIVNDDIALTPIHDIQGPGSSSPIVGAAVTTRGIVTGVKSNGFFIQEPDASVDADPTTSEGILVFTSAAPPAAAAVGNLVQVTATVTEFVPSQDPLSPPLTELTAPTVLQISSGNPLPAAIALSATFPDPAGPFDALERLEGMRVSVASLRVSAPTQGSINEAAATATSTGVFHGAVDGLPRPFREAGIQAPDPAPAGSIPPIPRFDHNPEIIRVDSDGLVGGPVLNVRAGDVVSGLIGPLDFGFRYHTVLPDPGASVSIVPNTALESISLPADDEFTVASVNLQRLFDTINDPAISEPVLSVAAFDFRLNKISRAIRDDLNAPDIVGVTEVENLSTLQALAARISSDAIAAAQADPLYLAFLVEGNDVGGIDVGFLVKTAEVAAGIPRVEVISVTQELDGTLFVNPDSSTEILNDRPPLRLAAVVHHSNGASFPIQAIVNHLRSLNGSTDVAAGSNGWPTGGERVRAKRLAQAQDLANLVQARQVADGTERILLLGDFNAFEINDGLVHSLSVIAGTPVPDNETAVSGDGVDLVNPDLSRVADLFAEFDYSFVFDGSAQSLDHLLINAPLAAGVLASRVEHAHINADWPVVDLSDLADSRFADHDPVVGYFQVAAFSSTDLSLTIADSADPVAPGQEFDYLIDLTNSSALDAADAGFNASLPVGTRFVSLSAPGGFSCTTPAVGSGGTVDCAHSLFAPGTANFVLRVQIEPQTATGTVLSLIGAATTSSPDGNNTNDQDTETTTVGAAIAQLSVDLSDSLDPVTAGNSFDYQAVLSNEGPSTALGLTASLLLPTEVGFVSAAVPGGWSCTTPAVGASGLLTCTTASLAVSSTTLEVTVQMLAGTAPGTVVQADATLAASGSTDNDTSDNDDSETTTVSMVATPTFDLIDLADPATVGTDLVYRASLNHVEALDSFAFNFDLPAGTEFRAFVGVGTCTVPAVGATTGTVQCNQAVLSAGTQVFDLTVRPLASLGGGSVLNASASYSGQASGRLESASADESTTILAPTQLSSTLAVVPSSAAPDSAVVFSAVISNSGIGSQADATGAEWDLQLPVGLSLDSASASAGAASVDIPNRRVRFDGTLGAGASVTLTINAHIDAGVALGSSLLSQGSAYFDSDGDGSSEASAVSDDPNTAAALDQTALVVLSPAELRASKTVASPALPGAAVSYQISVENVGSSRQFDLVGDELVDVLPVGLIPLSASADSGSAVLDVPSRTVRFNGAIDAGGSVVITIQATVDPALPLGTDLLNQANLFYDADGNGSNESSTASDDPTSAAPLDPTLLAIRSPAELSATKSVTTTGLPGADVHYDIVIGNAGPSAQFDNPGDEFIDVLPAELELVAASADAGTAVAELGSGTVRWNGAIGAGASVTVRIEARLRTHVAAGASVANQGTVSFDADGNGSNEAQAATQGPAGGATVFSTLFPDRPIPAGRWWTWLSLAALLGLIGLQPARRAN